MSNNTTSTGNDQPVSAPTGAENAPALLTQANLKALEESLAAAQATNNAAANVSRFYRLVTMLKLCELTKP